MRGRGRLSLTTMTAPRPSAKATAFILRTALSKAAVVYRFHSHPRQKRKTNLFLRAYKKKCAKQLKVLTKWLSFSAMGLNH